VTKVRAALALAAAALLAGCEGFKEAMSAHQDVVARAGGQELSATRLGGTDMLGGLVRALRALLG